MQSRVCICCHGDCYFLVPVLEAWLNSLLLDATHFARLVSIVIYHPIHPPVHFRWVQCSTLCQFVPYAHVVGGFAVHSSWPMTLSFFFQLSNKSLGLQMSVLYSIAFTATRSAVPSSSSPASLPRLQLDQSSRLKRTRQT